MKKGVAEFLPENQLLLDAVGEGIYGFDLNGHAVFINKAAEQMTQWRADELIGQSIHQFHHHSHSDGSHYPMEECHIYATLHDGKPRHIDNEVFWRKDGSCFAVEYTSTPIYKDDRMIGVVAIFRDISLQRQTEQALRNALKQVQALSQQLQDENLYLKTEIDNEHNIHGMVGNTPVFNAMMAQIKLVASTDSTVLIRGENGTGKELVARSLHSLSQRQNRPLVKVNCAAISPNLLESELFGHEKGAFTGAFERRKGRFELADKGTLFLDEIGELSPAAQSKLLRVLQEQELERVGGSKTIKVDIRIIAATNRDLSKMVEAGSFRMDLFYRLNVFPIEVPSLTQRIADVPLLVSSILSQLNKKLGKSITHATSQTLNELMAYSWPGNIRELQNVLEREAIICQDNYLTLTTPLNADRGKQKNHNKSLKQMEAEYIRALIKQTQGRISGPHGAAQIAGVPESTFRSKMKKLGIHKRK
ncbi:sigma 54-interacting transcriptional regulator [Motilimonas cestriensis]|uniref:Sigma 54-interacting transcriptional regulator n=1 Tax=Motilimonas cestriensis TaxID=2742685 RepID=A0ABS8WBM6_9GAMM|nr:sigma 54-interacting transcriptional regulator [Motilimonas cestriensis]MCE2596414.1 sigma 54-interacting transcriptional regulator [Motilimonas cestriensis]